MSEQSRSSQRSELTSALGFTADELAANRENRLSTAQEERLRHAARRLLVIGIGGIIVIGLGAAVLIFIAQQNNSAILFLIGVVLTIVNAAIVGLLVQNRLRSQSDLTQPVRTQEGIVHRTLRISGRTPTYILRIGNEQIIVNKPTFNAFIDGAVYKLYRTAGSKALISAELVGMVDE
jgi:hypothetical protein